MGQWVLIFPFVPRFLWNRYFMFVLKCLRWELNQERKGSLYFHLPSNNWGGERNDSAQLQRKGDFSVMGVGWGKWEYMWFLSFFYSSGNVFLIWFFLSYPDFLMNCYLISLNGVTNIDKLLKVFFFPLHTFQSRQAAKGMLWICLLYVNSMVENIPFDSVFNQIIAKHFRVLKAHGLLIPACFIMYF